MILAAAAAGYMVSKQLARTVPQLASGTALPQPRQLPAFFLTDQDGAPFGTADLAGRPSLLFFGFTNCPDVCPMTLAQMALLRRDPAMADLRLVFVTVDPERDDTAALRRYVNAFGEGFTGLRGEHDALDPLLQGMGVAHSTHELPGGGYMVDHSAALYYLNARGEWSAAFTPPFDQDRLRKDIATLLASKH